MKKIVIMFILMLFTFNFTLAQKIRETHTRIAGVAETTNGYIGILANLSLEIHNGSGRVFVDTMPLTEIDTQASARLAKEVACNILNINCKNYDFLYTIRSDSPIIGGPSAGGATTVITLAALLNLTVKKDVIMTGTINPDGSIGPVGGIFEKAQAAYEGGAKYFLIPKGQSIDQIITKKTNVEGPFITISTTTQRVNVTKYAQENWGLKVIEVSNVEDALKYFTGYEIKRNETVGKITTDVYNKILENISNDLVESANETLEELKNLNLTSLTYNQRLYIQSLINEQNSKLNEIQNLLLDSKYYSAASVGFQVLINSIYGKNLVNYYTSTNKTSFVKNLIESISKDVNDTENKIDKSHTLDSVYDIELVGTAFDRIKEAKELVNEAYEKFNQGIYSTSVYDISYAKAREITTLQWFNATNIINNNESIEFNVNKLRNLANERLEQASNMITYANTVFEGTTLTNAENYLSKSREAFKSGKYVYSIFESLQSIAESSLAMEIRGLDYKDLPQKINYKKNEVNKVINRVESNGYLPILSISYYEYASKFEESNPLTSLIYLEYAKQFSSISQDFIEELTNNKKSNNKSLSIIPFYYEEENDNFFEQLSLLITGFFLGYAVYIFKRK